MLEVDLTGLRRSTETFEQSETLVLSAIQELDGLRKLLQQYSQPELQEPVQDIERQLRQLEEHFLILHQMKQALLLAERQYEQTAKAVLFHCESSCIRQVQRKMKNIDLKKQKETMYDILFQ